MPFVKGIMGPTTISGSTHFSRLNIVPDPIFTFFPKNCGKLLLDEKSCDILSVEACNNSLRNAVVFPRNIRD